MLKIKAFNHKGTFLNIPTCVLEFNYVPSEAFMNLVLGRSTVLTVSKGLVTTLQCGGNTPILKCCLIFKRTFNFIVEVLIPVFHHRSLMPR